MVGDRQYPTGPGTVDYAPTGTFHQFINTGEEPAKALLLYVPASRKPSWTHLGIVWSWAGGTVDWNDNIIF